MNDERELWIFGYGSLVWRPAFPHTERRAGWISDWARRFWQGSTDHRGVPEAPGRVVTLVSAPGERCWGMAYRVSHEERDEVLATLDHRERGGFGRERVEVRLAAATDTATERIEALVYIATEQNPNYLGPAHEAEIAEPIRDSHGPSGPNLEYALRLADALHEIGADDDHVFEIARRLR